MKLGGHLIARLKRLAGLTPTSPTPPAYDVVISYAGEDREYAEELVKALQRQSIGVFYDQQALDRIAAEPLPQKLRDIYENQGRYCVALLSEHYKNKRWTMQELGAALARRARTQAYVLPILLDQTEVPKELSEIAFLSWRTHDAEKITDVILKKLGRSYRWDEVIVKTGKHENPVIWRNTFTDIAFIGAEGWLSVAIHVGGGYGSVGEGALLRTNDGGSSWEEIDKQVFPGGVGEFTWGPQGSRPYQWYEIGPIFAVAAYKRYGTDAPELWIASSTGIYSTEDGGASWRRSTPGPDDAERYAFFQNIANVEAFSEVYAVGWQGIAHWSKTTGKWELQLPSYYYPISGICVLGGSENRNVWAVGRAGQDEEGNWGSDSHGAIYHLEAPQFREWRRVDLGGVRFSKAQALTDILMTDLETVIAVGQQGMVVRGRRRGGVWEWETTPTPTDADLYSINSSPDALWAVGDRGVVLKSTDRGMTWRLELIKEDSRGNRPVLRRVKFFGHGGWILGDAVLLRSVKL